ncbi:PTS fructose transporter subunit IIA [Enterococcus asini]|uniref:PTS sugar transporter subunit IIA n=1 Tax=Enterococcus TaxID=1350 RepID=UPI00288F9D26|nr:PTS fructose transporter subunit IIA [Enterococcus asini]MDT2757169.1 PTS fructose transporter subunit IIA [Enterococcus asini]
MVTIILASHKTLAKGMKETAEYIIGNTEAIRVMTAYETSDYDIEQDTHQLLLNTDKVLVVTDVIGGSVNSHWMNYVYEHELADKVTIISGMTLSLVMELCTNLTNPTIWQELPAIIESAQASIMNCSVLIKEERK